MSDDDDVKPDPDEQLPTEQPTVDAGSTEGVREQRKRGRREQRERDVFWKTALGSPAGRREIWLLLHGDLHAFNTHFPAGPVGFPDAHAAWYERGKQDTGQNIYHRLFAIDPESILKMHQEHDARFAKPKGSK